MYFTRTLLVLLAMVAATVANAGDAGWKIVQSTGAVTAGGSGFMPAAVRPDQSLPRDGWVETGATGRVVLVRGLETIALGPNSRVMLPSQEVNGNTQVLQTLGTALYQIGKQKAPHFQVDTPYLAAVVKGTTFTVNVDENSSSVHVTEGLVAVAGSDDTDMEFVQPGFTATVSKADGGNVVVAPTEHAPDAAPRATPSKINATESDDATGKNRTVIATAIGETAVDVKEVSGGLANGVETAAVSSGDRASSAVAAATNASESSDSKSNSATGNAASTASTVVGSAVAAVDAGSGNASTVASAVVEAAADNVSSVASAVVEATPAIDVSPVVSSVVDVLTETGGSNGIGNGAGNGLGLGVGNGNSDSAGGTGNGNGLGLGLGVGDAIGIGKGRSS